MNELTLKKLLNELEEFGNTLIKNRFESLEIDELNQIMSRQKNFVKKK